VGLAKLMTVRISGFRVYPKGDPGIARGRREPAAAECGRVDVGAGLPALAAGLLAGLAVGPLADRLATNAPLHEPLLARVPRSPRLLLVTVATTLLGGACGLAFGLTATALVSAVFCWILVVITRTDLEHRLIPNTIVLPGTVVVLVGRTLDDPSVAWVAAALAAGAVLFAIALVYPGGMGMGDVKLAAFLGAGLGAAVVVAVFVGFVAAFVPAAVLLVRHGRAARKSAIPLGPFLALGGVVALFAGNDILDWYLG
jgi:leader peptidase (prepilin peptidase) / N-methyltransferase